MSLKEWLESRGYTVNEIPETLQEEAVKGYHKILAVKKSENSYTVISQLLIEGFWLTQDRKNVPPEDLAKTVQSFTI